MPKPQRGGIEWPSRSIVGHFSWEPQRRPPRVVGTPLVAPSRAVAAGERLVVAVGQWGIETPFAWRSSQSEKTLWDCVYDPLIMRDPEDVRVSAGARHGMEALERARTWTFKLRSGVQFHEGFGEMTAEDVKFTVEQNLKPDSQGGSAPFFRAHLDRIETPDKHTVVMHFKNRVWEVPSNFTQFVGYQNITSKKYIESVGEDKAALHPIGTGPFRHVEGKQGDYHRFEAVANHWRKTPAFKELVIRRIPDPATRLAGLRSGEIDIGNVFGDYLDQAQEGRACASTRRRTLHVTGSSCRARRRRTARTTAPRARGPAIPSRSPRARTTRARCGWR